MSSCHKMPLGSYEKPYIVTDIYKSVNIYIYKFRTLSGNEGLDWQFDKIHCNIGDTIVIRFVNKRIIFIQYKTKKS
jgi:hypothetical protein